MIIYNCRVVLPDAVWEQAVIRIAQGKIVSVDEMSAVTEVPKGEASVDAGGLLVGPGFIDTHCHGDGTTRFHDAPNEVAMNLLRGGVTTVLATLGYPDMDTELKKQVERFEAELSDSSRNVVGGIHLEGPYVNPKYGAQTSKGMIKNPDEAEYAGLLESFSGRIKWWTCAPELPGAEAFITAAAQHGVKVGAGHTEATPEQLESAIKAGLKIIIHWSNATGNPRAGGYAGTRTPGIDEAALIHDEVTTEIIPDEKGLHVNPVMAKLLYKAKGPDRIVIITDAGYSRPDDPVDPPGPRLDVSIDSDGNLAGSRLTMAGAARNFKRFTGCSWPELFRMGSLNAARLLGMGDEVGSLEAGRRANLILFDEQLDVKKVFLDGVEV